MSVCRFFLQGKCRFGENCHYMHPNYEPDYNTQQYNRYERSPERTNYSRTSQERYDGGGNYYSGDRYSRYDHYVAENNHRAQSYTGYGDSFDNRNERFGQKQQYNSYDTNYQTQRNNPRNYHSTDNEYGQNRFRWLSPDYSKQGYNQKENQYANQKVSQPVISSSTKKVPFSFKSAEAEVKKESRSFDLNKNEDLKKQVELVAEEARAWELGQQWPFSCFCPFPEKSAFPGFIDISPEELRFQAYKAEENNVFTTYVNAVISALHEVCKNRTQLKMKSPELLDLIKRVQDGEQFTSTGAVGQIFANLFGQMSTMPEDMNSEQLSASRKSAASTFRFVLPDGEASSKTTASDTSSGVYTPLDKLTTEERQQFESSTFTLGKIPTNPPPQAFCI